MHLNATFRVLAKSPFCQLDAARDCCRIDCKDLPAWKIDVWDVCFGVHRTYFLDEPHAKFLEDPVIHSLVCLGQG